jgi:hypothetical protein
MQLKLGRYYRDRMGQVHGPLRRGSLTHWPWTTLGGRFSWSDTGGFLASEGGQSQLDLIEEVEIRPVPGQYQDETDHWDASR